MAMQGGYLNSPEYQQWVQMQQANQMNNLRTPFSGLASVLTSGINAYGMKQAKAQYDAKEMQKASLLASLLQREPVDSVAATPALSNPETSAADLQSRKDTGAYNQPTTQAPDISSRLAQLLAGGGSGEAGSELVNSLAPALIQSQLAQQEQANQPITPYQRAQLGFEARRTSPEYLGAVAQAQRPSPEYAGQVAGAQAAGQLPSDLEKLNAQQGALDTRAEADRASRERAAAIRAGGTSSNVQSVQPLGDGTLLKVFRDGHTEITALDGSTVKGARNDPAALYNQGAATAAGKAGGVQAEGEPVLDANFEVINKALTAFDDPAVKAQASRSVGFGGYLPTIPGVNSEFKARVGQLQGQAFLQAYQTLRGGGQITEVEGSKATEAIARLNKAQTPTEFYKALGEAKTTFKTIYDAAKTRAARGRAAVPQLRGGAAPQAQPTGQPSPADIDAELRRRGVLK